MIGSIVGSLLSEGEGQIAAGVLNAVAGLDDPITFTLPGTKGRSWPSRQTTSW